MEATIISIQVGKVRTVESPVPGKVEARRWRSGIYKEPVNGPVWAGENGMEGDAQANRRVHGGPDKAVYQYPGEHYPLWRQELELDDLPYGGLGENLTSAGLSEAQVCVGDVFAVGEVRLQVSEPRRPCFKISRRWQIADFQERVEVSGRTGWYLRVLQPGMLKAGQTMALVEHPAAEWTIARVNELIGHTERDIEAASRLIECPYLAESCKTGLLKRIQKAARLRR